MAPVPRRAGFMLLDVALALAVVLMVAAVIWPALPRRTNAALLSATAMDVATLLRADRTRADRDGTARATVVDLAARMVTDARGRSVRIPRDIDVAMLTAGTCQLSGQRYRIEFRPDGSSCGAVLRLANAGRAFRVRVNWLTGWVDVVGPEKA
jgi:general secretion pathway protein H